MKTRISQSNARRLIGPRRQRPRRSAGFTLIELMITVAIVAILTAIAYPSYRNYVLRGQVVSATNALSAMSANMERWFQDNRQYTAANGVNPPCSTAVPSGTFSVSCPAALSNSPGGVFTGSTLQGTSFQLQAIGSGATAGFNYFIDQAGNQASTIVAPAPSSWVNACPTTWETKAGQC